MKALKNEAQIKNNFRDKVGFHLQNNKTVILVSILFVFFVDRVVSDLRGLGIPLALLLIWGISWLKRVGWSDLGIFRPKSWVKTILIGVGTGILFQSFALLQIRLVLFVLFLCRLDHPLPPGELYSKELIHASRKDEFQHQSSLEQLPSHRPHG